MPQYTIYKNCISKDKQTMLQFMEYHETKPGETLQEMIKRKKIKNINVVYKGHVEEEENWTE